jgi:hypothetical protein
MDLSIDRPRGFLRDTLEEPREGKDEDDEEALDSDGMGLDVGIGRRAESGVSDIVL